MQRNNNAVKHYNYANDQFKNYPFKIPNRNLAIQELNQAITLDPNFTDAYYLRGFAYLGLGQYVQAISDFNYVARTGERTDYLALRGEAYSALGMSKEAVIDAMWGIRLSHNVYSCYFIVETNLPKIKEGDLDILDKKNIFHAIKDIQNPEIKISLLKQCLDKTTPLGNRFWKTEFPWTGCGYEKGTLKDICDHLKIIDPKFVKPSVSITDKTIFTDNSARKKSYPDLNLGDSENNFGFRL